MKQHLIVENQDLKRKLPKLHNFLERNHPLFSKILNSHNALLFGGYLKIPKNK